MNVTDGGRFSPGNSPGTATVGGFSLGSGGTYQFELNTTAVSPGTGQDLVNTTGALSITAGTTPGTLFTIAIVSLDGVATRLR